ncbi:MAG: hypothetical protein WC508_04360 [Patescibacteria group bacterium]
MNKKIKITALILLALIGFLAVSPTLILAADNKTLGSEAQKDLTDQDSAFLETSGLGPVSMGRIVSYIIQALLSLLGLIFIILIIYAGLLWMTSAGKEEKVALAKKIIGASIIGLAIVFGAYAITIFVLNNLIGSFGLSGGTLK